MSQPVVRQEIEAGGLGADLAYRSEQSSGNRPVLKH